MTDTTWHPDLSAQSGPKYLALSRALREAIRQGELPPGARVPTVRDLAWRLQVTPGTVARAYHIATQEGLLDAQVGRGTYVAETQRRFGPSHSFFIENAQERGGNILDLRSPRMADVGQMQAISVAMGRVMAGAGESWIKYPTQRDEAPLRHAVLDWVAGRDFGPLTADDIALTHGGQSATNLAFQCCLRGEKPLILIEELAYPGFRHAARLNRADIAGIEMDQHGLRPDALDAACRRQPAQIVCLNSEGQNPTTRSMPADRRQEIAEVARAHDLQIIDDECFGVENADLPTLRAFAPDRVWHMGSLSKTMTPALRFGYVLCPIGMGEAGRLTAQHSYFGLARPISDMVLDLFRSGAAARLRNDLRAETNARVAVARACFEGFELHSRSDLPFVWLRLPVGWRASTFARMAEGRGVLVRSADEFALFNGRPPHAVRIALAGDVSVDRLHDALSGLAAALRHPPEDVTV